MPRSRILIGTAGWSIPRASAHRFAGEGTHLQRYARRLASVEINSSFHRPHRPETYARWASATPAPFRFAVKLPRMITHDLRLQRARAEVERFLGDTAGLGKKRGPLLVQLPPSLGFDPRVAGRFFGLLRARHEGLVVCEPRHPTWFSGDAEALLVRHEVARAAADPPPAPGADVPGGWTGFAYYRLHGSPRMYWSRYDAAYITRLATTLEQYATLEQYETQHDVWCVFDNTANGAALENAWEVQAQLGGSSFRPTPDGSGRD